MRDSKRLDNFYNDLCLLHKKYLPDLRFGQMCSNFFGWLAVTKGVDLFFPEEQKMLEYFREYCEQYNPSEFRHEMPHGDHHGEE